MNIRKTFFFTGFQTGVKIIAGLVMNKVVAVYLGPTGLAMLGQFQNFVTVAFGLGNASIQTGVVKYTAEYNANDEVMLKKMLKNAIFLSVFCSMLCALIIFILAPLLSSVLLYSTHYKYIFYVFGASLVFYSLNLYVLSVLNGLGAIGLYVLINTLISLVTLVLIVILTISFGLSGALLALIFVQSIVFSLTLVFTIRKYKFIYSFRLMLRNLDFRIIKQFLFYGLATFTSGVVVSFAALMIRHIVYVNLSLTDAGIWEGAWRIVLYFNLVFHLPFSIYYLPKISAARGRGEVKRYLLEGCKFLVPLMLLAVIVLFIFRGLIIRLLFSMKFDLMEQIILYMGIGEFFCILSVMLQSVMMAKNKIKMVVINSFIYNAVLVVGSYFMVLDFGFLGLGYNYLCVGILWFILNYFTYKVITL